MVANGASHPSADEMMRQAIATIARLEREMPIEEFTTWLHRHPGAFFIYLGWGDNPETDIAAAAPTPEHSEGEMVTIATFFPKLQAEHEERQRQQFGGAFGR